MRTNKHIRRVRHAKRPEVQNGAVHVTMRLCAGLPSMRRPRTYRVLERAFRQGNERKGFSLVHYSVQSNHLHMLVNAENKACLGKAMQGLAVRIARALNKLWKRKGTVFFDRYHSRVITPTVYQVKKVLRYVLQNARKHGVSLPRGEPDPFSSARWFNWWQWPGRSRPRRSPPIAEPLCWNTSISLVHGLDLDDLPGPRFHADCW